MTQEPSPKHDRISPWTALAWGVAIDVLMCVLGINGGPLSSLFHMPITFVITLILVPLFVLLLISLCNSPRYKHLK